MSSNLFHLIHILAHYLIGGFVLSFVLGPSLIANRVDLDAPDLEP
jgi:hypothetical protein